MDLWPGPLANEFFLQLCVYFLTTFFSGEESAESSEDPPAKRRRLRGASACRAEGEPESDTSSNSTSMNDVEHVTYTAELIMFDNKKHVLLTDGDYELALQEKYKKPGRKKGLLSSRTAWENVFEGQVGDIQLTRF